jgi:hypothetical protein
MKRTTLLPALLLCLTAAAMLATDATAQTPLRKPFGFGFSIGEPTAVVFKVRVGRSSAIDFGIGKSVMGYPAVHADYLWQFLNLTPSPRYSPYAGVGLAVGFLKKGTSFFFTGNADSSRWYYASTDPDIAFAGRGVIGISYFMQYTPLELFAEVNPIIGFYPNTAFSLGGGVGARFYIGR